MDFATLRDAHPDHLHDAANAFQTLDAAFAEHTQSWKSGTADHVHGSGWHGRTAEVALQSLHATTGRMQDASEHLGTVSGILREGAQDFQHAQSQLHLALDDARALGLKVHDDGSISWDAPSGGTVAEGAGQQAEQQNKQNAQQISDRMSKAVADASHADQRTAQRLRQHADHAHRHASWLNTAIATVRQLNEHPHPDGKAPERPTPNGQLPPKGATPAQVAGWWKSLTPEQQQQLIQQHPEAIGMLDGVPATARDQANRILLPQLIDRYQHKPQPLSPEDQRKLDGFDAVQKRLDGTLADGYGGPDSNPPLLLIGLSEEGKEGRAIMSYGNPDTAKNVSALVPGMDSTVKGAALWDIKSAKRIHDAAQPSDTASILYMGYDAPKQDLSVASKGSANAAAEPLDGFMAGLRASHQGDPAHVTVIGHSYGSLVVGEAARRPGGIAADDVILVGSPGTGASKASQFSVGADHVWVGAAKNDPVTQPIDGMVGGHDNFFGKDPASKQFGGQHFSVADGQGGMDSHDSYFGKNGGGGDSLKNIGNIVAGRTDQISRAPGR